MELLTTNSPFNQEQAELLNRLLPSLTDTQRTWLSGYLTALNAAGAFGGGQPAAGTIAATPAQAAPAPAVKREATVLYGSQTGNSHKLANKLNKKLTEQGIASTVSSMSDFKLNGLKKVQDLFIVVSTHGEGDAPDNAIAFYEFLHSKRAPQLEDLRFSVLALGDTSYEFFCQTGKDFDKRLEELGGKRIVDRVDCDVDFEEAATEWLNQVTGAVSAAASSASSAPTVASGAASVSAGESEYTRSNPFQAEVMENLNLNGRGSDRETRHVELSLAGSNLTYEPGDSLGIIPQNDPALVDALIDEMNWRADELVTVSKSGEQRPLRDALIGHYEISTLTKPLLSAIEQLTSNADLCDLLAPGGEQELKEYMNGRDLLDLARDFKLKDYPAEPFVTLLRKIPARLYSIASSPSAYPDEVHLTVRAVRYEAHGRDRNGVCSIHLAERVQAGDNVPVFIQNNTSFKLPEDSNAPIIMIGPGTGVAPFRAFVGEREETGAEGKSWLFYGDQHFSTDFLYQIEWQRWLKDGVLTRMDVAFSRDTDKKVYVQHRMHEKSEELFKWLQEGAYVYVCGDEKKMAHDVHAALLSIVEKEGRMSSAEAAEYVASMQQQKRYQRDVY
ncbi:assimilatory sulfite reductase (NADPH) flavoprotein subunit [Cohnella sp. GCM10027633]|uniref:assimilatory sulfite reductase (NADPH) flavoprotein subunit n=1 Tax=unclassified Cohnella TaxID=2636738 RepID=UPI00363D11A8